MSCRVSTSIKNCCAFSGCSQARLFSPILVIFRRFLAAKSWRKRLAGLVSPLIRHHRQKRHTKRAGEAGSRGRAGGSERVAATSRASWVLRLAPACLPDAQDNKAAPRASLCRILRSPAVIPATEPRQHAGVMAALWPVGGGFATHGFELLMGRS